MPGIAMYGFIVSRLGSTARYVEDPGEMMSCKQIQMTLNSADNYRHSARAVAVGWQNQAGTSAEVLTANACQNLDLTKRQREPEPLFD